MALSQRLDLRQTQALVMTPQLQQAIKLLQLSHLELAAYVDTELEQNPLLERDEGPDGGDDLPGIDQTLVRPETLRDHLQAQLAIELDDPADRVIGAHLVDLVEDSGYLTADLAGVAEILGCDVPRIEATLRKLQRFD